MSTAAQDEFNDLVSKNTHRETLHPEDRDDPEHKSLDLSEEDVFRNGQIDAAMRMPTLDRLTGAGATEINLPPASFDSGRATGVKGVIADARNYEAARKNKWRNRVRTARASIFGLDSISQTSSKSDSETDDDSKSGSGDPDEEAFLQEWRETRRRQLESDANRAVRNRRTSPSVRIYGRLDEVDALGYLDAIEKVSRETTVVVYVYDSDCEVSSTIEAAMMPLVKSYSTIHFVKVHYEDIEFDNAAVPAILAYRNQGDLFANLTGVIEMIPDDESFGTASLTKLFTQHDIL
ncbi:thioredoxin-like protein [Dactylonectria macrodidyma]|uniref:Thioredoxin-like protein n=1 Tax=Dactylonectria macrodidyma TaxID=307937 RepID=A0A9P9EN87_9HYPO|nr:thioredoxin-like protein [Dactylonectria macrodidyma]